MSFMEINDEKGMPFGGMPYDEIAYKLEETDPDLVAEVRGYDPFYDHELAHDRLSACFDVLAEERDHYYPVDAFILDVTMMAPTTVGQSLRDQLAAPIASNLLLSGELLTHVAVTEPETLAAIRHAVENGGSAVAGFS